MRPSFPGDLENFEPGNTEPAWAYVWHLWTLVLPRRSVDGGIIWGRVWRRRDGRRWLYKRFVEFDDRDDEISKAAEELTDQPKHSST